ncbi:MAG: ABC transporter permease subunit [Thermosediminibacteraceae bacterium]|nr:ABC transporter permease subunit [Thermosediminibacteraceae bacterium]
MKSPVLPPPAAVFSHLKQVFFSKIAIHATLSMYRIFAGLFISVLIGSVLGLLMGFYGFMDRVLSPVMYFMYPIPKIALNIPKETFYSIKSLGAGDITVFKEIILPAAMPELLTAVRLGAGTAISVLFFTENFGTTHGIGYFIMDAWMRVNYLDMYSGILVLGGIGLIIFSVVDGLEKIFCKWKK